MCSKRFGCNKTLLKCLSKMYCQQIFYKGLKISTIFVRGSWHFLSFFLLKKGTPLENMLKLKTVQCSLNLVIGRIPLWVCDPTSYISETVLYPNYSKTKQKQNMHDFIDQQNDLSPLLLKNSTWSLHRSTMSSYQIVIKRTYTFSS